MNIRPMTDVERRGAAKVFVQRWTGRGDEKQDAQNFWRELLQSVYGVQKPESDVSFEFRVKNDQTGSTIFIDAYIHETAVLIEQKGMDVDLSKHYKQSDGSMLTPFQQARRYAGLLPHNMNPRWIVVCNFQEFRIHDMNNPNGEPYVVRLADLEKEYSRLNFLVNTGSENIRREEEISKRAGEIIGVIYDALLKQYRDPTDERTLKSLNALCVRLVFCLYAEDAGIFGQHLMFHDYVKAHTPQQTRKALEALFRVLNQRPEERDRYLADDDPLLAAFPYVNGGLFADENIEIPPINEEIHRLILRDASEDFDWSEISPTIFGALFESTLNPETRRTGGMHYTSIENIHKVIDPLFLDDLKAEFEQIMANNVIASRHDALDAFQDKLASLTFLDPACGSGNFLTESYLSLRKLENQTIRALLDSRTSTRKSEREKVTAGQIAMGTEALLNPIRMSIENFYGIEINDFAVSVARTALWIAENQMMKETEEIIHATLKFLPLKTQANIVEGNALRLDWNDVVDKSRLNYIMGNPPFVGFSMMSESQKADMHTLFGDVKNLDYVSGWYKKASDYIQNTIIKCGLVSTNSITQGETVARLWPFLSIKINFAHTSFIWDSEATLKAHVHCVIIGFSVQNINVKRLYTNGQVALCNNINAYLCDAPDILVTSRNKPLCAVPSMVYGNKPADGGNLIIEEQDYQQFVDREPQALKYIHPLLGATEFINNKKRYCLWLVNASPADLRRCPMVMERIQKCKEVRLNSVAAAIRKFAETPTLFAQVTQPAGMEYIIVPCHSSEARRYVPMGFMSPDTIVTNAVQIIPGASVYDFGILTSNVHMSWMRTVCGRLEMRYRYSKDIVYNNFPWPTPTDAQRVKISQTAQAILDARALYPDASLADLYDELTMPPELRNAHQENDKAVMEAYGIKKGDAAFKSESACVAMLMKLYQELTAQ